MTNAKPKRRPPTADEIAVRAPVARHLADLVADRFVKLYGKPLGEVATQAFADWIVHEATDKSPELLKKDVESLRWHQANRPLEWDKRKPWLNPPKEQRLLKALDGFVRDAVDAQADGVPHGTRVVIDGTDSVGTIRVETTQ